MDPVSTITTALAMAATAALTTIPSKLVTDAYEALKNLLVKKNVPVEQFTQAPDSAIQAHRLKESLEAVNAGSDIGICSLAENLLKALNEQNNARGTRISQRNVTMDRSIVQNYGVVNFGSDEPTHQELLARGQKSLSQSDWREAVLHLRKAWTLDPEDKRAPFLLALSLVKGSHLSDLHSEVVREIETNIARAGGTQPWPAHLYYFAALVKFHCYLKNGMSANPQPARLLCQAANAETTETDWDLLLKGIHPQDLRELPWA